MSERGTFLFYLLSVFLFWDSEVKKEYDFGIKRSIDLFKNSVEERR